MDSPRAVVRTWRESECYLGHDKSVVWAIQRRTGDGEPSLFPCLNHLSGLAGHSLGHRAVDADAHLRWVGAPKTEAA